MARSRRSLEDPEFDVAWEDFRPSSDEYVIVVFLGHGTERAGGHNLSALLSDNEKWDFVPPGICMVPPRIEYSSRGVTASSDTPLATTGTITSSPFPAPDSHQIEGL